MKGDVMKSLSILLVGLVLTVGLISDSYAFRQGGEFSLEPSAGLGFLSGSTLYHISGTVSGVDWASELEWPVNSTLVGINLLWRGSPWSFDLSLGKNLSKKPDGMEDSDWLSEWKFSYTETDTSMEALFIEAGATYNLISWSKWNLGARGGYKYQKFSFSGEGVWNLLEPENLPIYVGEKVIDYKVAYNIPYLGIVVEGEPSEKLTLNGGLLLGLVSAKDEDDHVLRYKLSKGSCSGSAVFLVLGGKYDFTSRLFMKVSVEVTDINTSGHQDQSFYSGESEGVTNEDIDDEIKSSQTLLSLGLGFEL
jgi:outer membrane protease